MDRFLAMLPLESMTTDREEVAAFELDRACVFTTFLHLYLKWYV
ncbi:MAG: hypothetical protein AB7E63_02795 [Parachlamydia sp.]